MANPGRHGCANRPRVSHWHEAWKRSDLNDGRCVMMWRGRFGNITNARNYDSTREAVWTNGNGAAHSRFPGSFAWYTPNENTPNLEADATVNPMPGGEKDFGQWLKTR